MTQPDPTTGLPQLPEGQWWEVRKSDPTARMFGFNLFDGWGPHQVAIREMRTVTVPAQPGKHWWNAPTPATTKTEAVDVDSAYIDEYDLTPRAIRKAAYGLAHHRARKARTAALLGAYPPKKLEAK